MNPTTGATRRAMLRTVVAGALAAPALIGRARAASLRMRLSSSLPNDPKFANGRVYSDNLQKALQDGGLAERITVQFFPTISSGRRSTSSTRSSSA
ncbi:MAG: hypothetical protein WDN49_13920 [Acetobacteraceae bacterium]